MALYDYKCSKCEHAQEERHGITAEKPDCPKCGAKEEYAKQVSKASFQLKGTGWYQTDFKNNR
jgi:putative FmdB family regulatory protein